MQRKSEDILRILQLLFLAALLHRPLIADPPLALAEADFHGNGKLDSIFVDLLTGEPRTAGNRESALKRAVVADFNADGKLDIATILVSNASVVILSGRGDGTFEPPAEYTIDSPAAVPVIEEMRRQGISDVLISAAGLSPHAALTSSANILITGQNVTLTAPILPATCSGTLSNANCAASAPNPVNVTAIQASKVTTLASSPSTTILTSSQNPSVIGRPVTLNAQIAPASATGAVAFYDSGALLGRRPVSNGMASMTVTLPTGIRTLRALYLGDTANTASAASLTQTVSSTPAYGFLLTPGFVDLPAGIVARADFNRDGILDVATSSSSGGVTIFLGRSDGTYRQGGTYPSGNTGGASSTYQVADANGDGNPDLVVTWAAGTASDGVTLLGNVSVLLGNGDGTFQPPRITPLGGSPKSYVISDFNGDGIPDFMAIIVPNSSTLTCFLGRCGAINLFLGNGDGTFAPGSIIVNGGVNLATLAIADFNNDGVPDFAYAISDVAVRSVNVVLGKGDGTFGTTTSIHVPDTMVDGFATPSTINEVVDIGNDGNADILAGSYAVLGNGDGTFRTPLLIPSASPIGDMNGDGKLDLASFSSAGMNLYLGNGDGSFQLPLTYTSITDAVVAGDLNGDGRVDLLVPNGSGAAALLIGAAS